MRLVDRRIGFLFGLFLLALLAVAMRAWWLDTVKAGSLRSRALSQQIENLTLSGQARHDLRPQRQGPGRIGGLGHDLRRSAA